ncbi:MAG TPA: SdrD B-like domain-containing protein, partial [Acidobacteriota bacterium]|nr:SdrD B-like domain-containing protein [Acidobacteriota bacterium]
RYFLNAGQTLTLTFQATVNNPLVTGITEITNTASATCTQINVPISALVTDPVVNPDQASAMVGDLVWLDSNGNGVREVGESGLPGVGVTLKDSFGTPLQTTTTDSQGRYLFTNVTPSTGLYVEVNAATLPAGLVQTAPAGRSDHRSNPFDLLTFLGNNRDEFGTAAYTNNNGSVNWASNWTETDATGGGATGGEIRITGGELRINGDTGGVNNLIRRSLGVPPGAVAATLTFDYRTTDVEAADSIVLQLSEDGVNFTTVATYNGASTGNASVDITRYLSANAAIRFKVNGGYAEADDYFFIDNVDVSYYSFSDYLDADLGYRPQTNTAAIGDLVWSDADGDGVRDAGEPGLPGITVQLYLDTNGDGLLDAGDTLVTTTLTGADGSYLFAGVAATGTEDYLVYVDPNQAALTAIFGAGDVQPTTPSLYPVQNAASGGLYLNGDFGFTDRTTPSVYTITDRVWFDADADGTADAGEPGLAGVTVALLDASSNIIATVTSGADGTFVFTGVPAGVRYSWRITDQGGVLNDYYGTTTAALANRFQMPGVLTGDANYAANPNFGYNQTRSIGDAVFNDADGDGVRDDGELGFGGVEVRLYRDTNGDGTIDAGEPLVATTTTDSNGNYLFSGLTDGNYVVSIPVGPTGYTLTGTDGDPGVTGQQLAVVLSGGGSNLDIDFGYQADTPRNAAGTLWEDLNQNGMQDAGENGLAGVTITIWLDDGDGIFEPGTDDVLFSTVTTDASGAYSFTGLSDEMYFIQPTDQGGVLSGYSPTYEETEGTGPGFNGYERVDLTGGDATGIDFGYRKDVITFVLVAEFQAYAEDGRAVLEWTTAAEADSLGFYIERIDPATGDRRRLDGALLPALLESRTGGVYRFADESAAPGETWIYELIEVATDGRREVFGPFTVTIGPKGPDAVPEPLIGRFSRSPRAISPADQARLDVARQRHEQALTDRRTRSLGGGFKAASPAGNSAKLAVRESGVYVLSFEEISRLLNMTPAQAAALAGKFRLALTNRGKPVAYSLYGTSGILFYAEAPDGIYASENIYWLSMGKGSAMAVRHQAPLVDPTGTETFKRTVRAETNRYAATTIFTDPESDYWVWDYLIAGTAGQDRKTYPLASPGLAAAETAILSVRLVGGSESAADPDHHVRIMLNGTAVGEHRWNGTAVQDLGFSVAADRLADGGNTVEVISLLDAGVPYSVVIVDRFELSYPSFYLADDDRLTFNSDDASDSFEEESRRSLLAGGFSTSNILVLDITNPKTPAQVRTSPPVELDGGYAVAMRPASHAQYFACTLETLAPVADAYPDQKSYLTSRRNEADYLVITPPELRAAAEA